MSALSAGSPLYLSLPGGRFSPSELFPRQPFQAVGTLDNSRPWSPGDAAEPGPRKVIYLALTFLTCFHPTVSSNSVSPQPYRPFDLRWRLFQGNSKTLIRNRPGLMDDTKLAPASRSEGVILNYSDLLGGEQVRRGFRGLPPGKTCGQVPEQSETDASCAIHPPPSAFAPPS